MALRGRGVNRRAGGKPGASTTPDIFAKTEMDAMVVRSQPMVSETLTETLKQTPGLASMPASVALFAGLVARYPCLMS